MRLLLRRHAWLVDRESNIRARMDAHHLLGCVGAQYRLQSHPGARLDMLIDGRGSAGCVRRTSARATRSDHLHVRIARH